MMYGAPVPVLHRGQKGLATGMRWIWNAYRNQCGCAHAGVCRRAIYFVGKFPRLFLFKPYRLETHCVGNLAPTLDVDRKP